jgi:hypothetical protein
VLVDTHRQTMTTSESPALNNSSPIGGRHPLSKTMDTQTTADFWLISSLRHNVPLNFI